MKVMSKYPPVRLAALNSLIEMQESLSADPEFLSAEDCPYDPETKDLLRKLLTVRTIEKTVEIEKIVQGRGRPSKDVKLSTEDQQAVLDGIKKTMEELNDLSDRTDLEVNESIQISKTRTALLDQLLKMQERHFSITKTQEFIETVVGILDDVVDEKGREAVLNRVGSFR